jgi:hypothetical protein
MPQGTPTQHNNKAKEELENKRLDAPQYNKSYI